MRMKLKAIWKILFASQYMVFYYISPNDALVLGEMSDHAADAFIEQYQENR